MAQVAPTNASHALFGQSDEDSHSQESAEKASLKYFNSQAFADTVWASPADGHASQESADAIATAAHASQEPSDAIQASPHVDAATLDLLEHSNVGDGFRFDLLSPEVMSAVVLQLSTAEKDKLQEWLATCNNTQNYDLYARVWLEDAGKL
eukprot:10797171-Karenia_brevis.AAC.1